MEFVPKSIEGSDSIKIRRLIEECESLVDQSKVYLAEMEEIEVSRNKSLKVAEGRFNPYHVPIDSRIDLVHAMIYRELKFIELRKEKQMGLIASIQAKIVECNEEIASLVWHS
jgi:hypothetical protein